MSKSVTRLLVHEQARGNGGTARTWLEIVDGALVLRLDDASAAVVELSVLEAVMRRYGKPLAPEVVVSGPTLALGGGRTLSSLRHRARYDVIARDFLVYQAPGFEPIGELAASITAALSYLAAQTARG